MQASSQFSIVWRDVSSYPLDGNMWSFLPIVIPHLPVFAKVACGGDQYVCGTSLVRVPINFLLQPLTTCV